MNVKRALPAIALAQPRSAPPGGRPCALMRACQSRPPARLVANDGGDPKVFLGAYHPGGGEQHPCDREKKTTSHFDRRNRTTKAIFTRQKESSSVSPRFNPDVLTLPRMVWKYLTSHPTPS